jgi:histidinol-phosphatase
VTLAPADSLADDLALALDLADVADALSMGSFRAADLVVETKPDLTPVSEADRAVERAIREQLAARRPHDAVLGEEYGAAGAARRRWVIDPIDGTKNYVRGVPVWATLIALLDGDDVVVGVVSAPALARRWWAARGEGAFVTDPGAREPRRLHVSAVRSIADASFSYSDSVGWSERGAGDALESLLASTWRQRAYGDFWSHMMVAEGVVDVAAEPQLESYDMAALIPIVEEAGGRLTAYDGGSAIAGGSALSSNGLLHDQLVGLLRP